jgi:hypothetical protein
MSIHFSSQITIIEYNYDSITVKKISTTILVIPNPNTNIIPHQFNFSNFPIKSDLDMMRRFTIQLANKSPSLFIEDSDSDNSDNEIRNTNFDDSDDSDI